MSSKPLRDDPHIGQILAELRRHAFKRRSPFNLVNAIVRSELPADLVTLVSAAAYSCTSIVTIRRRIRGGSITPYYSGGRILVSLQEVVTHSKRLPRSPAQIEAARRALADINSRRRTKA